MRYAEITSLNGNKTVIDVTGCTLEARKQDDGSFQYTFWRTNGFPLDPISEQEYVRVCLLMQEKPPSGAESALAQTYRNENLPYKVEAQLGEEIWEAGQ